MDQASADTSRLFVELGCAIVGLAILARVANRWAFSAIPLYLPAGLAFGKGGLAPLEFSKHLVARGEFSIVIAGLGAELEPQLGPVSAAYVLFLAILGPFLARAAK